MMEQIVTSCVTSRRVMSCSSLRDSNATVATNMRAGQQPITSKTHSSTRSQTSYFCCSVSPECFVFASAVVFVFLKSTCRLSYEFVGQWTNRALRCQLAAPLLLGLWRFNFINTTVHSVQFQQPIRGQNRRKWRSLSVCKSSLQFYLQTKGRVSGSCITLNTFVEVWKESAA